MSQDTEAKTPVQIAFPPRLAGESLVDSLAALRARLTDVPRHGFHARLDALHALSESLLASGSTARPAVAGAAFLAGFLRKENLEKLIRRELPTIEALTGMKIALCHCKNFCNGRANWCNCCVGK